MRDAIGTVTWSWGKFTKAELASIIIAFIVIDDIIVLTAQGYSDVERYLENSAHIQDPETVPFKTEQQS